MMYVDEEKIERLLKEREEKRELEKQQKKNKVDWELIGNIVKVIVQGTIAGAELAKALKEPAKPEREVPEKEKETEKEEVLYVIRQTRETEPKEENIEQKVYNEFAATIEKLRKKSKFWYESDIREGMEIKANYCKAEIEQNRRKKERALKEMIDYIAEHAE